MANLIASIHIDTNRKIHVYEDMTHKYMYAQDGVFVSINEDSRIMLKDKQIYFRHKNDYDWRPWDNQWGAQIAEAVLNYWLEKELLSADDE